MFRAFAVDREETLQAGCGLRAAAGFRPCVRRLADFRTDTARNWAS